ncbi:MAG: tetratricopeptide repeat protein [Verrucomicrobiales bacterium]|nr:tetratricopeptide repeat protein [Verrucomicrobiales bacterium]
MKLPSNPILPRLLPTLAVMVVCIAAFVSGDEEPDMAYADLLFKRKEFTRAAQQYQDYVDRYPYSGKIQNARFRLGESYEAAGRQSKALEAFQKLIDVHRTGVKVGEASFRLGLIKFNNKNYSDAVIDFERASRELEELPGKYQAKYYNARSLQLIDKTGLALALYDQLIRTNPGEETNHFLEKSILEAANIEANLGNYEKAQDYYRKLISTATHPGIREEAVVRSGLEAVSMGHIAEGEQILKEVENFRKDSIWRNHAQIGAIFIAYAQKDYPGVVSIYSSGTVINSAGEYRPKVLLMVADAFRIKGDTKAADRLYTLVAGRYPDTESGVEAGFRRLTMQYKETGGTFPAEVKKYATALASRSPDNPYIDKAWLMLAEWHFFQAERGVALKKTAFATDQYRKAAAAYVKVREQHITPALVPAKQFHHCWASLESGDIAAGTQGITTLLERFPDNELVPQALAKRGEIYLTKEDFTSALADFQLIISKYPKSPSLELAMERRALIYTHKRMLSESVSCYESLLEHFPETDGIAEAHYWIGEGYFEQKEYRKALPHLDAARKIDPELYTNRSLIRMILSYHSLNQIPEMTEAARIYIQAGRDAGVLNEKQKRDKPLEIPRHVLASLGEKLAEKRRYQDAEFFLNQIVDLDKPDKTEASVWKVWSTVKIKLEEYHAAIKGFDRMLVRTANRGERGYAYVNRGRAQFAIGELEKARLSARECIRLVKQGRINAEARLLIADIAGEQKSFELAAREYELIGQIFNDPQITPRAIQRGIEINRHLGKTETADSLEQQLKDWNAARKKKR